MRMYVQGLPEEARVHRVSPSTVYVTSPFPHPAIVPRRLSALQVRTARRVNPMNICTCTIVYDAYVLVSPVLTCPFCFFTVYQMLDGVLSFGCELRESWPGSFHMCTQDLPVLSTCDGCLYICMCVSGGKGGYMCIYINTHDGIRSPCFSTLR